MNLVGYLQELKGYTDHCHFIDMSSEALAQDRVQTHPLTHSSFVAGAIRRPFMHAWSGEQA
jgi:hypothetical protein